MATPPKSKPLCNAIYGPTGVRCTKKYAHYHKARSWHANEKPGYEITWDEDGNVSRNPH